MLEKKKPTNNPECKLSCNCASCKKADKWIKRFFIFLGFWISMTFIFAIISIIQNGICPIKINYR